MSEKSKVGRGKNEKRSSLPRPKQFLGDFRRSKRSSKRLEATSHSPNSIGTFSWNSLDDLDDLLNQEDEVKIADTLSGVLKFYEFDRRISYLLNLLLSPDIVMEIHKHLTYLQRARDDILLVIHKSTQAGHLHSKLIIDAFDPAEELVLCLKQYVWSLLENCWYGKEEKEQNTIRCAICVIEKEEILDRTWNEEEQVSGFKPPGRPLGWRRDAVNVLKSDLQRRFKDLICRRKIDSPSDAVWLVKHLDFIRLLVMGDLKGIKNFCTEIFPDMYNITQYAAEEYHAILKQHLKDMMAKDKLQTIIDNIALLRWIKSYRSENFMLDPELQLDIDRLDPLLSDSVIQEHEARYMYSKGSKFKHFIRNALLQVTKEESDVTIKMSELEVEEKMDASIRSPKQLLGDLKCKFNFGKPSFSQPPSPSEAFTWSTSDDFTHFDDLLQQEDDLEILDAVVAILEFYEFHKHLTHVQKLFLDSGSVMEMHKHLTYLLTARDKVLLAIHTSGLARKVHSKLIIEAFLSAEQLFLYLKQCLWSVLENCWYGNDNNELNTIRFAICIIEKEEMVDQFWSEQQQSSGFNPPGRPRKMREDTIELLKSDLHERFLEVCRPRNSTVDDSMLFVKHLESIKLHVIADITNIKSYCTDIFPVIYNLTQVAAEVYHTSIKHHLTNDLLSEGKVLSVAKIAAFLSWIKEYRGCLESSDLKLDLDKLGPLVSEFDIEQYEMSYVDDVTVKLKQLMRNSLLRDVQDWYGETLPEVDSTGCYSVFLPRMCIDIIQQHFEVARTLGGNVEYKVLLLAVSCLEELLTTYTVKLTDYRNCYLKKKSGIPLYEHHMIAHINSSDTFKDYFTKLTNTFHNETEHKKQLKKLQQKRTKIADMCCLFLVRDGSTIFADGCSKLFTKDWLKSHVEIDALASLIRTSFTLYSHLKLEHHSKVILQTKKYLLNEYLHALFKRSPTFKSLPSREEAAKKFHAEAVLLKSAFNSISRSEQDDSTFNVIENICDILKLEDASMMQLELSAFIRLHPQMTGDQLVTVLMMRGDTNKNKAREMVQRCTRDV